jgi:integrase
MGKSRGIAMLENAKRWSDFRSEILALYEPPARSRNTWKKMEQVLGKVAKLGVKSTAEITPALVNRFLRINPDWRQATITGYLSYLRPAFAYAAKMKYAPVDPFSVWDFAPTAVEIDEDEEEEREEAKHLPFDDVIRLLEYTASRAHLSWKDARANALISLFAYTGVRRNEALYRKIEDFDLDRRVVWIKVRRRKRVKTKASSRAVPFPRVLVPVLESWFGQCGCEWAFPNFAKRPWTGGQHGNRPIDAIQNAARGAGLAGATFLMLRHSFSTHGERFGLGELMVQRILGHTTPRTQKGYRHADIINMADAVADIEYRRPSYASAIAGG